jgi:hypothetical protein
MKIMIFLDGGESVPPTIQYYPFTEVQGLRYSPPTLRRHLTNLFKDANIKIFSEKYTRANYCMKK